MATYKQYLLLFVLCVVIGLVAGLYSIPFPTLIPILILMATLVIFVPLVTHLYLTKDMNRVEKFLKALLKQPTVSFYYFLANNRMKKKLT